MCPFKKLPLHTCPPLHPRGLKYSLSFITYSICPLDPHYKCWAKCGIWVVLFTPPYFYMFWLIHLFITLFLTKEYFKAPPISARAPSNPLFLHFVYCPSNKVSHVS